MEKLQLRKATSNDLMLFFKWVNDPATRAASFNSEKISLEEHRQWFENALNDENIFIFVLMLEDIPIGQVRLNKKDNSYNISYSIDLNYRAQGYGKLILCLLENEIKERNFNGALVGYVKKDNVASQLIFKSLGYSETEEISFYRYEKKEFKHYSIVNPKRGGGGNVLFLTNNRNAISLFEWLNKKVPTYIYSEKLEPKLVQWLLPKIIVSYNYKYIISKEIIELMRGNIINLHISYLPWNRGAAPNLWSFIDDTPKGVTIHKIETGLDTGAIIYQKEFHFDEQKETLSSSYEKLNTEIVELLKIHWEDIYNGNYISFPQTGKGTMHKKRDLENLLQGKNFSYGMTIQEFKKLIAGDF